MADATAQKLDKWSSLVKEAWRDESLKRRLIANPAAVLEEHGLSVPPGIELRVVENTDKVKYLTLPARPDGELSIEELERVAAGGEAISFNFGTIKWTYTQQ